MLGTVLSVQVGQAREIEWRGQKIRTAILKQPVDGEVAVMPLGLQGDEQADPTVHGGLAKAVYAYPAAHYPFWQTVRAQAQAAPWDAPLPWGSLGENLSLQGVLENQVWVGDVLRFPGCSLAVSEPRQPCNKFNAVMGFAKAAKLMVESGWCGFYLAVREPGTLCAGQSFELVPGPREVLISELFRSQMGRG